jgi:DNA-binding response OmpR family regulator
MNECNEPPSGKTDPAPAQTPAPDSFPYRILLADDETALVTIYSGALTRCGYSVATAADGADAWKALQEVSYDLLITDNIMPHLTGPELINQLRVEGMTLPVILISGTMPPEDLERHPWLHYARLAKPFTIEQLLTAVKTALIEPPTLAETLRPTMEFIRPEDKTLPAAQPEIAAKPATTNPRQRILVVDDNSDTRKLSMDVLTHAGYAVEAAKDGAAGWVAIQANNYDLVVTDNQMPNLTGLQMIEKLRSAQMEVPVIMATGILPLHEFTRKPWLKPDAMLQKPFSATELVDMVRNVLRTDDGNGGGETLLPKYL